MLQGIEGEGRRVGGSEQKIKGVSFRKRIVVGNVQGGLAQRWIGGKFKTIDEVTLKRKNPFFEWRSANSRREGNRGKKNAGV